MCFNPIRISGVSLLFDRTLCLCASCARTLRPAWRTFELDGIPALALYDYNQTIKEKLYLLKGCGDFELAVAFLDRLKHLLRTMYRRYALIPMPSWHEDDAVRGFNHVEAIFASLKLPLVAILKKTAPHKQAWQPFENRERIKDVLALESPVDLANRRVLLVDDVMTSGATLKAAVGLVRPLRPRSIKILVIAKTRPPDGEIER